MIWHFEDRSICLRPGEDRCIQLPIELREGLFLCGEVLHTNSQEVNLVIQFRQDEEVLIQASCRMLPRIKARLFYPMELFRADQAFLPVIPGTGKRTAGGKPSRLQDCNNLRLFTQGASLPAPDPRFAVPLDQDYRLTVENLRLTEKEPEPLLEGQVFVDRFGQVTGKDWPEKIRDEETLRERLQRDLAVAQKSGMSFPEGFSRYGGCLRKRLEPTGWFHTQFSGGRWWLVDPDGYVFLSHGMCYGSRMGYYGVTQEEEAFYEWLPEQKERYADAWIRGDRIPELLARYGQDFARSQYLVNFGRINYMRVFGGQWREAWTAINGCRLKRWGINTLGVGVDSYPDEDWKEFVKRTQIPYALTLQHFPSTVWPIFRDFPDVFAPEYEENSREYAKQLLNYRDDPLMIGYFMTNEPHWLFAKCNIAERLLELEGQYASKDRLIAFLEEKYSSPAALTQAWNHSFSSFADLNRPIRQACSFSEAARQDLEAFHRLLLRRYVDVPAAALKAVDPHHLNLAMRFSHYDPECFLPCQWVDVFSFNCYRQNPGKASDQAGERTGKPVLIGEYHAGARDKGLCFAGLVEVSSQEERGKWYRSYWDQLLSSPWCLGAHYFEYNDMPPFGRFDGAAAQTGLIDVCGQEYEDMTQYVEETGRRLYDGIL